MNGDVSLEWLVDSSEAIGTYRVLSAPVDSQSIEYRAELIAALRGTPPATVVLKRRSPRTVHYKTAPQDELLVFCEKGEVRRAINLTNPAARDHWGSAVTADFRALRTKDAILSHARQRISTGRRFTAPHPEDAARYRSEDYVSVEAPFGSSAFHALWLGSSVYLLVPTDLAPKPSQPNIVPWLLLGLGVIIAAWFLWRRFANRS